MNGSVDAQNLELRGRDIVEFFDRDGRMGSSAPNEPNRLGGTATVEAWGYAPVSSRRE